MTFVTNLLLSHHCKIEGMFRNVPPFFLEQQKSKPKTHIAFLHQDDSRPERACDPPNNNNDPAPPGIHSQRVRTYARHQLNNTSPSGSGQGSGNGRKQSFLPHAQKEDSNKEKNAENPCENAPRSSPPPKKTQNLCNNTKSICRNFPSKHIDTQTAKSARPLTDNI